MLGEHPERWVGFVRTVWKRRKRSLIASLGLRPNEKTQTSRRRDGSVRPRPGGHRRRLRRLYLRRLPHQDPRSAPVHPGDVGPGNGHGLHSQREVWPRRRRPRSLRRGPDPRASRLRHGNMDLAPALHPSDILRLHHSQRPSMGRDVPHRNQTLGVASE